MKLTLNFYGITAAAGGPAEVVKKIARDFSYFSTSGPKKTDFKISLYDKNPGAGLIPSRLPVSFYHRDFVQYEYAGVRYTHYNGGGLSVFDMKRAKVDIYSADLDFLHERCYLAVLSLLGAEMEKRGLYRVHGFSFSYKDRGAIFLAPSGGGKTSLFLELLKDENVKFFSDDTAVIDRRLNLHPFPLRIGICGGGEFLNRVEGKFVYELNRRKYGKKILIDTKAFPGRIAVRGRVRFLLAGRRWNSRGFKYRRGSRLSMVCRLFRDLVVGLGLAQVLEYMNMRFKGGNIFNISGKIIRRFVLSLRLVLSCSCYTVYLGRDGFANRRGIAELLETGN